MSKFTAFVILVVLRIMFHPSGTQKVIAPFASQLPQKESVISVESPKGAGNSEMALKQIVAGNEMADMISAVKKNEEKYLTGTLSAFSSEKPETGLYRFNENELKLPKTFIIH